ncbi:hypothetical protein [Plantactinospora veratri]
MTVTDSLRTTPPQRRRDRHRRPAWEEKPSTVGQVFRGGVLTGVVLAVLIPLWVVLVTSLASRETINAAGGLVVVPRRSISRRTGRSSPVGWSPRRSGSAP